jgi:hypothetical protein
MTAPVVAERGRALGVLIIVAVLVLLVGVGAGFLVFRALDDDNGSPVPTASSSASSTSTGAPDIPASAAEQDAIAMRPMQQLPKSAAQPQPLVAETAGPPIAVPKGTGKIVPGGPPVTTGFPRTPQGALGQLAAIDEAALSTVDATRIHEVYQWAAAPGAVSESEWRPAYSIGRLLESVGNQNGKQAEVSYSVVQGQIKGTVGKDFVVACVLGEFNAMLNASAKIGVGDCQRMVWNDGRWWIGPGAQPPEAPHAWPGSADAVRGGWRELKRG